MPQSNKVEQLLEKADKAVVRDDLDRALMHINRASEIDPQNSKVFFMRGGIYSACDLFEAALEEFDRAMKRGLKDESVYMNKARAHFGLDQYKLATTCCDKAISLNPQDSSH